MYHALPQHDAMWPSTLFPKETKFDSAGISAEAVFALFRKGDADTLGSFWDHVGVTLGSFRDHVGVTLGSFWDDFGIVLG